MLELGTPAKLCGGLQTTVNRFYLKNKKSNQMIRQKLPLTKTSLWSELSDLESRSILPIIQEVSAAEGGVLIL